MPFDYLKLPDELKETLKIKFNQVYAVGGDIQKDRHFRLSILTYQIGDLAKMVAYESIFGEDSPETKRAYHGERKKAVADALIQLLLFAHNESLDYDELLYIGLGGLDEFLERKRSSSK